MLLAEFDEEAFVRDIREEGREEGKVQGREEGRVQGREEGRVQGREEGRAQERAEALKDLIKTLQKFISSPQELYQTIISNGRYKDLTFEEVQKIAEM